LVVSRNSSGPFSSRRFRLARSSAGAAGSARRSIVFPAMSAAVARRDRLAWAVARPLSISARIAVERSRCPCAFAQRSRRAISSSESRSPIIGRTPVAGRPGPRFFRLTEIDRRIFLFSAKFLVMQSVRLREPLGEPMGAAIALAGYASAGAFQGTKAIRHSSACRPSD